MSARSTSSSADRSHGTELSTDDELQLSINSAASHNRMKCLENEVIENYLARTDPDTLLDLQQIIDTMTARQNRILMMNITRNSPHSSSSNISLHSDARGTSSTEVLPKAHSKTSLSCAKSDVPALTVAHKISMVEHEVEEVREANTKFMEIIAKKRASQRAKKLQLENERQECEQAKDRFLTNVVLSKSYSPQVAYNKYARFFEKYIKEADYKINKLRLRRSNMVKAHAMKKAQLKEKIELGESLRVVDLQIMKAENEKLTYRYEEDTNNLTAAKMWGSRAHSEMSHMQKLLKEQKKNLNDINRSLMIKREEIDKYNALKVQINVDIEEARVKLEKIKALRKKYVVPDVLEYLKLKDKVFHLQKDLKSWSRRRDNQHKNLMLHANKNQTN